MGTIKERNGMDLTEAEDIKKRWQEYTEELYKKKTGWKCQSTPLEEERSLCFILSGISHDVLCIEVECAG